MDPPESLIAGLQSELARVQALLAEANLQLVMHCPNELWLGMGTNETDDVALLRRLRWAETEARRRADIIARRVEGESCEANAPPSTTLAPLEPLSYPVDQATNRTGGEHVLGVKEKSPTTTTTATTATERRCKEDHVENHVEDAPRTRLRSGSLRHTPSRIPKRIRRRNSESVGSRPSSGGDRVIVCTGFSEETESTTSDVPSRQALVSRIEELGGTVSEGGILPGGVTHVVAPPNHRTLPTMVACLTQKWLLSHQWILDSSKAGHFLPEGSYGAKGAGSSFKGMSFFFGRRFLRTSDGATAQELALQIGGGVAAEVSEAADFILVANREEEQVFVENKGRRITYEDFCDLVQPLPASEESPSSKTPRQGSLESPSPQRKKQRLGGKDGQVHPSYTPTTRRGKREER
eukprot:TRINITY_DN1487_c0_g1_i2.p1 TRINITY_DN1487_c0_g1~~TRINITY_DN1487_c0_g1_i2.p1  ORF type:complete len:420 (-),score=65.95 TRINITY_DN1487_c0_g1_i2:23-1246(-)